MAAQPDAAPGADMYFKKLRRAQELPEQRRGAEVQAFLEWHAQLEAAAAELAPGSPTDRQILGALRYLLATFCVAPNSAAVHPLFMGPYHRLHAVLAPLVHVAAVGEGVLAIHVQPATERVMAAAMTGARPLSAADLVRLLLYSCLSIHVSQYGQSRALLVFVKPYVLDEQHSERLGQQLAALVTAAADGPALPLPAAAGGTPAHMLRTLWHSLQLWTFVKAQERGGLEQLGGEVAAEADLREAAAALALLQPGSPRGAYWQARASFQAARRGADGPAQTLRDASFIPQWLAALERAQEAGDNFWVCSIADELCATVLVNVPSPHLRELAAVPPSRVAALLEASSEALRRLRKHCPRDWWVELAMLREQVDGFQPLLAAHLQHSPGAWRADICRGLPGAVATVRVLAQAPVDPVVELERRMACDGCGKTAVGLRQCPKCRQARFCGQPCFQANWSRHLPACRAARAAAAAGASRA